MTLAAPANPALEDAVRREPTNPDVIAVYADWLTEQGSPYGELMSVRDARAWAACGLPGEDRVRVTWRHGLWETLRVERRDVRDADYDDVDATFAAPPAVALAELELVRWSPLLTSNDIRMLIAMVARYAWSGQLRRLSIGDDRDPEALATQAIGWGLGDLIAKTFPRLEHLTLRSGIPPTVLRPFELDGLQLDQLRTLEIEIAASRVDYRIEVDRCRLPALDTLVLRGAGIGPFVPALLRGSLFEIVRHLGLHGLAVDVALDAILPNATLAANLETLDLSGSSVTSAGARALITHRGMFRSLTAIDVTDTAVPAHDVAALRGAYPGATVIR